MGKIICEICGTTYPETAESCPICGYSRDMNLGELIDEDIQQAAAASLEKDMPPAVPVKKSKEIFDFDEVNAGEEEEEEDASFDDEEEDEDEEPRKSNTLLVIFLVIVIMLLLAATGFVFFRYFLPNMSEPTPTIAQTAGTLPTEETETPTTTELVIPCENLVLTGGLDTLTMEGGHWLLHVVVSPEDTTDKLEFVSEDESVVTVDETGKLTAVGEGETYVNILCGDQKLQCHIVVDYSLATEGTTEPETIPPVTNPEEETEPQETEAATEPEETKPEETEPEETTKETQGPLKDVKLKLKKTDITLGVGLSYTIPLDCDLDYDEIEWYVEEPFICTVENGTVTVLRTGTTDVVAKYGDQVVECRIRCTSR